MASILLKEKIHEALASVVPITLIVLALSFSLAPLPLNIMALFIGGAVLLILGMGLFSLGVDIAMSPMGEAIGVSMTRTRKVGLVLAISFFIGLIITVAEPDLQVLAEQVSDIPQPCAGAYRRGRRWRVSGGGHAAHPVQRSFAVYVVGVLWAGFSTFRLYAG